MVKASCGGEDETSCHALTKKYVELTTSILQVLLMIRQLGNSGRVRGWGTRGR